MNEQDFFKILTIYRPKKEKKITNGISDTNEKIVLKMSRQG